MERLLSETRLVVGLNLMIGVAMSYVHCLLCNGEAGESLHLFLLPDIVYLRTEYFHRCFKFLILQRP